MPSPDVGAEAGKAGAFTLAGMAILHGFNFFTRRIGTKASTQQTELDATLKAGGALRAELMERLAAADKRIDDLEEELHEVRTENEKLRREVERMETQLRTRPI